MTPRLGSPAEDKHNNLCATTLLLASIDQSLL